MTRTAVVDRPEQLTSSWLSGVLDGEVTRVRRQRVGSGQIGTCYRLELEGAPEVPRSLVAKLPAENEEVRILLVPAYRAEVSFYQDLAHTVAVRTPVCHHQAISDDGTAFTLLLEDAFPAEQGDQITGCSPEAAAAAVVNLAGLHGPRWCDPRLLDLPWLKDAPGGASAQDLANAFAGCVEPFVERFTGRLAAEDARTLRETAERIGDWVRGRPERFGPVHGDYRPDNLLFHPGGGEVIAVDWQTLCLGHPLRDLAFFLGTGLRSADRAGLERDLVARYHAELVSYGVDDYDLEECFDDYRFTALQGPLTTVLGCVYGSPTERGDRMFLAMTRRSCAMIRDLGTLDLI